MCRYLKTNELIWDQMKIHAIDLGSSYADVFSIDLVPILRILGMALSSHLRV